MNFHLNFGKFEGWKGRHFYGRPRAALSLATPLIYWQGINRSMLSLTLMSGWFYKVKSKKDGGT